MENRPGKEEDPRAENVDAVLRDEIPNEVAFGRRELHPQMTANPTVTAMKNRVPPRTITRRCGSSSTVAFQQLFDLSDEIRVREGLDDVGVGPKVQAFGYVGLAAQGG